jgi:Tfp pilus assembly protein FimT
MTAVVSRERARTTGLTAAAGVLMLAIASVMMIVAAPAHGTARLHLARSSAVRLATDVCHQLTSRSDSPAVRACQAVRPPQGGALVS